jgi:diaminohydroxyphosphoribosylaminopyrimidine deaminase/5-amino-6-(5-phosphoribosylamino)uracil reductase
MSSKHKASPATTKPVRFTLDEHSYMERALQLARRGEGRVEPNPMVGCVIVRSGRIISEGYHRRYASSHAEVEAIRRLPDIKLANGATAYVTLEPCNHYGKTPPCTEALIAAGIKRVVAAHGDPNPIVAGTGFARLRATGIEVHTGLRADEAAEMNAPFLTRVLLGRPYVIGKWAQSLDGRIATRTGDSKWITGPEARAEVHELRARVDAIAVGVGTVLADDPLLTARDVRVRRVAARVVFDSRLRIPLKSQLVRTAQAAPLWVLTTPATVRAEPAKLKRLLAAGVEVIACRAVRGRISPTDAMKHLAERGCINVMVEGGGELLGSLLDARLLDEVFVFTAPILIGGAAARPALAGEGAKRVLDALRPVRWSSRRIGHDFVFHARLTSQPLQFNET